jgi:hypothetical protein
MSLNSKSMIKFKVSSIKFFKTMWVFKFKNRNEKKELGVWYIYIYIELMLHFHLNSLKFIVFYKSFNS